MYQLPNNQNMQNGHNKIYKQQQRYWEQWDALPPQSSSLWQRYRSQHPSFQLGYCGCIVTFAVIFLALCSFGTLIGTIPQVTAHQRTTLTATPTLTTALPMTVAKPKQQIHITASPTPKLVRPTPNPIRPRPTPPVRPKLKKR